MNRKNIFTVIGAVIASTVNTVVRASVFMLLWNWFVAPLGVIEINIFYAFGLIQIHYLLTYKVDTSSTDNSLIGEFSAAVSVPCVAFIFGLVMTFLM